MSQAFVKEEEGQWLHDVAPSLSALIAYLTRENNNVRVYEKRNFVDPKTGLNKYEMSNGLSYFKDENNTWTVDL